MKRTHCLFLVCIFFGLIICKPVYGFINKGRQINNLNQGSKFSKIQHINYFVENKGQLIDQFGNSNPNVLFYANFSNYNVLVSRDKFSIELFDKKGPTDDQIKCHRIDYYLENANTNSTLNNFGNTSISLNYQNDSKEPNEFFGLKTYETLKLCEIYPHIDIEFQIVEGQFKYNFIVNPGGYISDIKIKIDGSIDSRIDSFGKLNILTSIATIEDFMPYVYTLNEGNENNQLDGKFIQYATNCFGFEIETFDLSQPLVIDPAPWITFFGGSGKEEIVDMAVSNKGYIYVCGNTTSTTNIATTGAFQNILNGTNDLFISKFSMNGQLIWSSYIGGNGSEYYGKIAIDSLSNVYVTGGTNSQAGISTVGAHQTIYGGGSSSVFLIKLDSNGIRKWATYLGGNSGQYATSIALSKYAEIYISGYCAQGDTLMTTAGSMNRYGLSSQDVFIEKFNSDGVRIWGTYYGGKNPDYPYDLAVDDFGSVFVAGITSSDTGIAYGNSFQKNLNKDFDGFILKMNSQGQFMWATYFGGDSTDHLYSIAVDKAGNSFCTGFTKSKNGIADLTSMQLNLKGSGDALVIKLDSFGNKIWSTYFGSEGHEFGYHVLTDIFGNIYIGGLTNSQDSLITQNAFQVNYGGGGLDGFIVKLSPLCTKTWATYTGGDGVDEIKAIVLKDTNELLFGGNSTSNSGISTNGAYQVLNAGNQDGIIGLINIPISGTEISNNQIGANQNICFGNMADSIKGSSPLGGNGLFSYKWIVSYTDSSFGFSPISNSNTQSVSPKLDSNIQYYRRVVSSDIFQDTSNAVVIRIANKLNVGFKVNQKIQCLKENNFNFTDTTRGSTLRLWDFGNGDTSSQKQVSIKYLPSIDNAIKVKLISYSDTNCTNSYEDFIYLILNPKTSTITGDTNSEVNNNKQYSVVNRDGSTYTWIFKNGSGSSNKNQITIKWITQGFDTLKVIEKSGNGCNGDTVSLLVHVKLKNELEEFASEHDLVLFPNPTEGIFWIMNSNIPLATYIVTNSVGVTLMNGDVSMDKEGKVTFDFSKLNDGIYYLQLVSESLNDVGHYKILIRHN